MTIKNRPPTILKELIFIPIIWSKALPNNQKTNKIPKAVNVLLRHKVTKSFLFSPWVKLAKIGNIVIGSIATKIKTKFSRKRLNISKVCRLLAHLLLRFLSSLIFLLMLNLDLLLNRLRCK